MMVYQRSLPYFRYHPDPVATGVILEKETICLVCGQNREFVYIGPFYCYDEVEGICPWCIANGMAARKFNLTFVDSYGLELVNDEEKVAELIKRTPGYFAATDEWPAHCGDFCKLLGPAEWNTLESLLGQVENDLQRLERLLELNRQMVLADLQRDHSPLWAFLFQCLVCGECRLTANYE